MKTSENLLASLVEKYTYTVNLGLQNVLQDDLPRYLDKLFSGLNGALESFGLDAAAQEEIPVRFYGTAGMRTVSANAQNRTYQIVTNWISNNTAFIDIDAKTIPGEYEALYNWLAVNTLNGAFAHSLPTAAVFDLGGGSAEIAYETTSTSGPSIFEMTIANQTHLTVALPWFTGNDWSRNQYLDHADCFNPGYPMPDLRSSTGNFADCQVRVDQPFISNPNLHPMVLSVPFISQDVHLLSSFYYAYDFLVYPDSAMPVSVSFDIATFSESAEQFCSLSWNDVMSQSSMYDQDDYTSTYCFGAALMEGIYYRTELGELSKDHNLWVTKKINGTSVSWPIGVVAQLVTGIQFNQLPSSMPTSAPTAIKHSNNSTAVSPATIIGCVAAGAFLLVAFALLVKNAINIVAFSGSHCGLWKQSDDDSRQALITENKHKEEFHAAV